MYTYTPWHLKYSHDILKLWCNYQCHTDIWWKLIWDMQLWWLEVKVYILVDMNVLKEPCGCTQTYHFVVLPIIKFIESHKNSTVYWEIHHLCCTNMPVYNYKCASSNYYHNELHHCFLNLSYLPWNMYNVDLVCEHFMHAPCTYSIICHIHLQMNNSNNLNRNVVS